MPKARARSYLSPTLVLLAFDWADGEDREDFLGFAILREPGFDNQASSWLPNRLGFNGPAKKGEDLPSNVAPIQKFMWWDARINTADRGKTFKYTVTPVTGTPGQLQLQNASAAVERVTIPLEVEHGIGSYFNRAVVSSQAFVQEFTAHPQGELLDQALAWLANGMQDVIPQFLTASPAFDAAIYHLADRRWVIPALEHYEHPATIVYHSTTNDDSNAKVVAALGEQRNLSFAARTHTTIMHNKFVVRISGGRPEAVLHGSANFTTEGLTSQANLLHTWESPELAALYQSRQELLAEDPAGKTIRPMAGWSDRVTVGDAKVRVFFAPEPNNGRMALGEVVRAVRAAQKSVVFCLFSSTDEELRDACFAAADDGKMMFGLINRISTPKAGAKSTATTQAIVETYHRSGNNKDVYGHSAFTKGKQPAGFWWEISSIRAAVDREAHDDDEEEDHKTPPEVFVHHKFIVIDAETDDPTIFTGSANMSNNSSYKNDENMLEIRSCPRMAHIYLAEFLRLYEHYRARAQFSQDDAPSRTLKLQDRLSAWGAKYYKHGSPEYKSRINMANDG
jgi:phosphatidylserine/phosphatidylglycerophosphate/cardiolipin synthase-like enzyme